MNLSKRYYATTRPWCWPTLERDPGNSRSNGLTTCTTHCKRAGVRFLAIGVVTSEVATTETIFNWANALKSRTDYLIVRNHRNGDDFSALESSEPGQRFLKVSKIRMRGYLTR